MTQTTNLKTVFSVWALAIATLTLAGSILFGVARIGAVYGNVSSEHEHIFRLIQERCK